MGGFLEKWQQMSPADRMRIRRCLAERFGVSMGDAVPQMVEVMVGQLTDMLLAGLALEEPRGAALQLHVQGPGGQQDEILAVVVFDRGAAQRMMEAYREMTKDGSMPLWRRHALN